MTRQRKSRYKAVPGAVRATPSFEGPIGELRLSRTLLAELLRRLFTTPAIGGGPPRPPYGPGDMLRLGCGRGPGDNGRGAWLNGAGLIALWAPAGLIDLWAPAGLMGRGGAMPGPARGEFMPGAGDIDRDAGDCPGGGGRAYWLRCDGLGLDGLAARQVLGTTPC